MIGTQYDCTMFSHAINLCNRGEKITDTRYYICAGKKINIVIHQAMEVLHLNIQGDKEL